jgi:hypothetical protein
MEENVLINILLISQSRIFSCVRPFSERAVSNLDRAMNISLWV